MPAKEDTYRSQRALHIVFALSSVAMFVSITWMIVADHFREWKNLQRDFVKFDAAKAEKDSREGKLLASNEDLTKFEQELAAAKQQVAEEVAAAKQTIKENLGKDQKKDQQLSFLKAERDSKASFRDIAVDKGLEHEAKEIEAKLKEMDAEIEKVRIESEDTKEKIKQANEKIKNANDRLTDPNDESSNVTDLEKKIAEKKKEIERIKQKQWTIW